MKVLLASASSRELQGVLTSHGHEVTVARDVPSACGLLASGFHPELAVIDDGVSGEDRSGFRELVSCLRLHCPEAARVLLLKEYGVLSHFVSECGVDAVVYKEGTRVNESALVMAADRAARQRPAA